MEENKFEIKKRKRIRKLLLLKINDELKQISKYKSNIKINSKTIQELNKIYNKNDILLYEKSIIYSNYIKTEETIITKNISPINISKEIDNRPKLENKMKNKEENKNKNTIYEIHTPPDDDSTTINYVPKKIELGRKKFLRKKSKIRNNASIPNFHKNKHIIISDKDIIHENEKEKEKNNSTKLGCDFHLHKLVEKISLIKNNENTEVKIRENIKKLRNYCYQLRKKKKKVRKISRNNSLKKKSKDRLKKYDKEINRKRRNTIVNINKDSFKTTLLLMQKKLETINNNTNHNNNQKNSQNKLNNEKNNSESPTNPINQYNNHIHLKKKSTAKVVKLSNNFKLSHNPSNKNYRYSAIKYKEKNKFLKILNEENANKTLSKKNTKKKYKKQIKTEQKDNSEVSILDINKGNKEIVRSSTNIFKLKFDNFINNNKDESKNKNKNKHNKLKANKKYNSNIKKIYKAENNKDNEGEKRILTNINAKNDKIELHDNLKHNKSCKKLNKFKTMKKENSKNAEDTRDDLIKLKRLSIIIDSNKKLIDTPDRKDHKYSIVSNYQTNAINDINHILNEKINKNLIKRSKKSKD